MKKKIIILSLFSVLLLSLTIGVWFKSNVSLIIFAIAAVVNVIYSIIIAFKEVNVERKIIVQ